MDPRAILRSLAKGNTTPELLSYGGALETQIATLFINKIIEKSGFLKRINTRQVIKQKDAWKALNVADESLTRRAEGVEPTASQWSTPVRDDITFENLKLNLFYGLNFTTILENADMPNFEAFLEGLFAQGFANDMCRLGFLGVEDDFVVDTGTGLFTHLNKGWLTRMVDLMPAGHEAQIVNTNGLTTVAATLDALIDAMPADFKKTGATALLLSQTDFETYCRELGVAGSILAQAVVDGKTPSRLGYPLVPENQMPVGYFAFTELSNLWMTVQKTDVQRYREVKATKQCIEYTFIFYNDYGIGMPERVCIGFDQGGS